jgi:catalase-peroxidase
MKTVALIAGGHTFRGKPMVQLVKRVCYWNLQLRLDQILVGKNSFGTGSGGRYYFSGLEGAWTTTPTKWSNNYLKPF